MMKDEYTDNLLPIDDNLYYIDIDAISDYIKISKEDYEAYKKADAKKGNAKDADINPSTMINITKYEMTKMMIEILFHLGFSMEDTSDLDETEKLIKGVSADNLNNMPLPFKLAFNTLTINKIVKTYEPTNRKDKRVDSKIKK